MSEPTEQQPTPLDDIPRSSLEQEYDLATYGDWMSDENQQ